jgi:hypothetical protein
MRTLESRLHRLEQRQQPHSARESTDAELLRVLGINAASFTRLADAMDAGEVPTACTAAERDTWALMRALHSRQRCAVV